MARTDPWWSGHGGYAARIMSALAAEPDRTAVHWRGRAVGAADFAGAVTGTARTLREHGVGPGRVLGVLVAPNSPDMLSARYAAHLVGAAVCYLRSTNAGSTGPVLSADEQLRILLDTGAAALLADAENEERARTLVERARGRIALLGAAEARSVREEPGPAAAWDPPAPAVIGLTSGSTGRPKGILLSARGWTSRVEAAMASSTPGEEVRILVVTPLSHTVGPMADAVLASGGSVLLHERMRPEEVLRAVEEHRVTRTYLATPHVYELADRYRADGGDLSSLRQVVYGGCPASPTRIVEAAELLGPVLVQGYGASESGRMTFLGPHDHLDPETAGTVGRPFPGVRIKVCRPGTDQEAPAGETGEVCVSSPHLMEGYWGDPARTARTLRGGWYHTGDLGHLDAQGRLHLLGRIADVVKTEGIKVYPAIVEREILRMPAVAQAAVYGVRDESDIEHVHAAVVPRAGARVTAEEVRDRVGAALSGLHAPEEVLLLDAMPLSTSGKPDRSLLRRKSSALVGTASGRWSQT
ncbi:class I adenylate-forming enzyme family protein [Phaeacidiphilus oryzae]|uniref:class I adenylate-forming enzyme family protein n=1 Tax=Phaeacidiphilus oryzae TaxID=348818 RepID=UPI00068A527C|nr:AMP-binding protein [Phaeacidiphilus oryzae]